MTEKISPAQHAMSISKAWGNRFPVDVRFVAMEVARPKQDPIVRIVPLEIGGLDGILAKKEKSKKWTIAYSSQIREPGKINFVIAHELGHYLCHRHLHNQLACTKDDMFDFPYSTEEAINMEQEANKFASYLLMPIADFRHQVDGQEINIDLLRGCAARYDTSLSATGIKLMDFIDRPVVMIVSEGGKVKWSSSSRQAFRMGLRFKKGMDLPKRSLSYLCAHGGIDYNNPTGLVIDPPVWAKQYQARESAIAQPYYNSVLTLLEFEPLSPGLAGDVDPSSDAYDYLSSFSARSS